MNLSCKRRLAADLLKCGVHRVWIDPDAIEDVMEAVTRSDIRSLINAGVVEKAQKKGVSRGRIRAKKLKLRQGRRRGIGSRKGTFKARNPRKRRWINRVRILRATLRELKAANKIDRRTYRVLYGQAKAGRFKSRAHLLAHIGVK